MLIRVQSSDGTKRLEVTASTSIADFFRKVENAFSLGPTAFCVFKSRGGRDELVASRNDTLGGSGLRHGDMVYLTPRSHVTSDIIDDVTGDVAVAGTSASVDSMDTTSPSASSSTTQFVSQSAGLSHKLARQNQPISGADTAEDEVDRLLWQQDGKIPRPRDLKLCRHGDNASCIHCTPLEPYDSDYLKQNSIKHLSFHSYMRQLCGGVDRGKFASLDDISCRIKPGCSDHPPWPRGICSKCQPSAITLNRQVYRHVDSVVFENAQLVERFLDGWRCGGGGGQRCGLLLGRYEPSRDVPLGVRATVVAIYEPPQLSSRHRLQLLPDSRHQLVVELAAGLALQPVGWMFTDLLASDASKGTVKYLRDVDTWFLSAQECMMAGHFQSLYPNRCRLSPSGYFGSKFVTVVVSGDKEQQVHMEAYQLSNQGVSLVRDNCLVPTVDAPELGWVRHSTNQQYVPDVFYKEKDSYGNDVTRMARPLPIAYLLVDVPVSTPRQPVFSLPPLSGSRTAFTVENRSVDGNAQDFAALARYLSQFGDEEFIEAVSDFHVLLYIASMDTVSVQESFSVLVSAVRQQDVSLAEQFRRADEWQTVEQLILAARDHQASASSAPPTGPTASSFVSQSAATATTTDSSHNNNNNTGGVATGGAGHDGPSSSSQMATAAAGGDCWSCQHCTFLNQAHKSSCDMCQLPRM